MQHKNRRGELPEFFSGAERVLPHTPQDRRASAEYIARTIARGGLSNQKAKAIRNLLDAVVARFGEQSLEPLRTMFELFSRPRLRDPIHAKQLNKGLLELGEEGAVQVFEFFVDNTLLIGAVGQLQFEVVEHRLRTEYGVDATFARAGIHTARWVTCADAAQLVEFTRANSLKLAKDVDGNLVYLADTRVNLSLAQERWPKVMFHDTREHGQLLTSSVKLQYSSTKEGMSGRNVV